MKYWQLVIVSALLLACGNLVSNRAQADGSISTAIASAVSDPARPEIDRSRDAARKPAEALQFSGVKPGDAVADFNANAGYFTRLLADVVGASGHVYAIEPVEIQQYTAKATAELQTYAADHPNVSVSVEAAVKSLQFPLKLDLFWISQNYHDLHNSYFGPADIAAFNKAVFNALKPGGTYIVLDHRAAQGAPADVTESLHRMHPLQCAGRWKPAAFGSREKPNSRESRRSSYDLGVRQIR